MSDSKIRVVLLGKTGSGKSSLCNTLFGEALFKTDDSANSGTSKCEAKTRDVDGRSLTLIDTPGFFDTDTSEEQHKDEVLKCITECAPGPHAFLIFFKVEKFTPQEKQFVEKILQTFSEEVFKYAIIVFTHGDQLPEGMKIKQIVQNNAGLRDLVSRCGGRCHVFDNRYWNQQDEYRSNQFQMEELLTTIEKMVEEHHGGCYTNEMLQQVERMRGIQMSVEEIREEAKEEVYHSLKISAGVTTGMLQGAFLGVPLIIGMFFSSFRKAAENVKPVVAAAAKKVAERVECGGSATPGLPVVMRERSKAVEVLMRPPGGGAASGWSHHPTVWMFFSLSKEAEENMKPVVAAVAKKVAEEAESGEKACTEAIVVVISIPARGGTVVVAAAAAGVGCAAGGSAEGTIVTTLAAAARVAAVGGAAAGGCVGYREADKASTIMEAAENTAREVWDVTKRSFQL